MTFDARSIRDQVTDCIGTAVVHLPSGDAEAHADGDDARQRLDRAMAAVLPAFEGDDARAVGAVLARLAAGRGGAGPAAPLLREAVVRAGELVHVVERLHDDADRAVVLVCDRVTNLGLAVVEARAIGLAAARGADR